MPITGTVDYRPVVAPGTVAHSGPTAGGTAVLSMVVSGGVVTGTVTLDGTVNSVSVGTSGLVVLAALSATNTAAENSAAIQDALTAATAIGAEVSLPGGTFDHNGFTVPPAGGFTIRGNGRGVTILRNVHATNASVTYHGTAGGPYTPRSTLTDMRLTADSTRASQVGLDVELASRFTIRDVEVDTHGTGVKHHASWDCTYDTINVNNCTTGWHFPVPGSYTSSTPVAIRNGSAWSCTTAVQIDDGLEVLTWIGGDWNSCTDGIVITGDEVRNLLFAGINFERITNDDISIGDASTGPNGVTFQDCRFLRTSTGTRSVYFRRGASLLFLNDLWTNYTTGIRQDSSAGTATFIANSAPSVTTFLDSSGTPLSNAAYMSASPNFPIRIDVNGPSSFTYQLSAFDGVTTKNLSGAGKTTVSDSDFSTTPVNGSLAVVRNTTDGTIRHAIRANDTWKVSAAYS